MLSTLRRIVQEVSAAPGLDAALDIIVRRVHAALQVDACSVYLAQLEDGPQRLILRAGHGINPAAVGRVSVLPEEGLVGLVAQRAEPLNLERATSHPRFIATDIYGDRNFETFLGVPIIHQSRVLGVLVVAHEEGRRFGEDEVTFMVTLAAQLAGSIMHAVVGEEAFHVQSGQAGSAGIVKGLSGALGVGIGECVVAYSPSALDDIPDRKTDDPEAELRRLRAAIEATRDDIRQLSEDMRDVLPEEERALFDVYVMMLEGESLWSEAEEVVRSGLWAPSGLRRTIQSHVRQFQEMTDAYLAERAGDIRDLGRRILMKLSQTEEGPREYPQRTILVGHEVSAAQIAEVPKDNLAGIVSMRGSGSSHVAILARALGVPTVMGASDLPITRLEGKELIVDGYLGWVFVQPDDDIKEEFVRLVAEEQELTEQLQELKELPAETTDGVHISLLANTGLQAEISPALIEVADGLGLYRTEMPFQVRDRFPGEDEQYQLYRRPLEAFAPNPCFLRTLDIGGDKKLPYFSIEEENPFLGWRGIRVTLDHPEIFLVQVRAMLRANEDLGNLRILLPMISRLEELQQAMALVQRAHRELLDEGLDTPLPQIGVMIEVPAAVYQIESIAKRVDFVSVGSNDLTQYLLAVDRNNERVAKMYDGMHPAVLHALVQIKRGASRHGKPVSVCGEFAGDPMGAILLLGMGIDSLSMSAGSLLRIKWVVRTFSQEHAREVLERALEMEDGRAVRAMLIDELEKAGLGGLVRAGK
ncbi:MAG: phosphoenolpyruvate--protein phosphotransferase [Halofilum sp. (in: g-proteobacteria)]|nr:phosphoenolpyruvate--protein phosphotransferase [Halofilum sp. (in: g-proteobacteria)]